MKLITQDSSAQWHEAPQLSTPALSTCQAGWDSGLRLAGTTGQTVFCRSHDNYINSFSSALFWRQRKSSFEAEFICLCVFKMFVCFYNPQLGYRQILLPKESSSLLRDCLSWL